MLTGWWAILASAVDLANPLASFSAEERNESSNRPSYALGGKVSADDPAEPTKAYLAEERALARAAYINATKGERKAAETRLAEAERLLSSTPAKDIETERLMTLAYSALQDGSRAAIHYHRLCLAADGLVVSAAGAQANETLCNILLECRGKLPITFFKRPKPNDFTKSGFREALSRKLTGFPSQAVVNPIATNSTMRDWAVRLTASTNNDMQKARSLYDALLVRAIKKPPKLLRPATAEEVFASWNDTETSFRCQEFAYLYEALARCLGLKAYNASVDEDCYGEWNFHSCAAIFLSNQVVLVDIPYGWFGAPHRHFVVQDDLQAAAEHLSQMGRIEDCQIACQIDPRSALCRLNLFTEFANRGRLMDAKEELAALSRLSPEAAITYQAEARMALEENEIEKALTLTDQALRLAPEDDTLYILRGSAYAKAGKWADARKGYESALERAIYETTAANARAAIANVTAQERCEWAEALQKTGDWDGVLSNLDEAISVKPDFPKPYYMRGRAHQVKGELSTAFADYSKVVELDPGNPQGYVARALIFIAKGDVASALTNCATALRLDPNCAQAFYARGGALQAKGEMGPALQDFDKAVRLNPQFAEAYFVRSQVKQALGDIAGAASDRARAVQLRPELSHSSQEHENSQ